MISLFHHVHKMGESSVQNDDNEGEHVITSGSKQKVILTLNGTGGVMVSEFTSSVVDCRFEPLSGQTKDFNICIGCFSAKHTTLWRQNKGWLARNQNNVSRVGQHVYPQTVISVS